MSSGEPRRPDPDALLAEAAKAGRGRLKVFLGMAPGVGKTYEMLSAARRRKESGGEVLVGVVETHGRRETEALLEGMEVLARRPIEAKGRAYLEFDLDTALARKPALLLVDEYAHSNAPSSRHPKRWQDVDELLSAGIDVWTTLNVQHLESLVDVVWKITGVRQRETVPDSALSRAQDIELVDITPDELRQRLEEGKVYLPDTARMAAANFFKPENLTALRELALRRMAQTVDDQLLHAMRQKGVEGPWAAGERILVLVGPGPMASSLVRAGRRLSDMMMDAPWTVAYVERPSKPSPDAAGAARISAAFKLAEQLGGTAMMLTGDDIVSALLEYARRNNVTQIVVGKSRRAPRWRALFGQALIPALIEKAAGAALHIVTEETEPEAEAPPPRRTLRKGLSAWRGHLLSLLFVAVAGGVAAALDRVSQGADLAMIFLVSVLMSALMFGLAPAVTAATAAALAYNFFFLAPRLSFVIGHATDVLTFLVFFAVALTTGWMAGRIRDQGMAMSRRASAITALLAASRTLQGVEPGHAGARLQPLQRPEGEGGARQGAGLGPRRLAVLPGPARRGLVGGPEWLQRRRPGHRGDIAANRQQHHRLAAGGRGQLVGQGLGGLVALGRGRGAAPLRQAALGPAQFGQPRPAHAPVHGAGRGHHPARIRQVAG